MTILRADNIERAAIGFQQTAVQRGLECRKGPKKPSDDDGAVDTPHGLIGSGVALVLSFTNKADA